MVKRVVISRIIKGFFIVISLPLLVIVTVVAFDFFKIESEVDNSFAKIFKILGIQYDVKDKYIDQSIFDFFGIWVVDASPEVEKKLQSSGFFVSDVWGKDDFKRQVERMSGKNIDKLSSYNLYQIEMELGDKTICKKTKCSIYVLVKTGERLSYFGIFKS